MNQLKRLSEKVSSRSNLLIAVAGMILLISLILIYLFPHNRISILIACIACGFMNLLQGLKYLQDPKKKTTAWSVIMLGILVIAVGIIILQV